MDLLEICKSIIQTYSNKKEIRKAAGGEWGRKIPIKKMTSDGRLITYWVSPEDLNQGKLKGQQDLFGSDEMDQEPESEDSYYSKLDKDTELYQIKPLLVKFEETNPALAKRIAEKYTDYKWGRETREIDIKLDYETTWFYKMAKNHPDQKDLYYKDFLESTQKMARQLNNRKLAMARLKVGSKVKYNGQETKIKALSDRGYPVITVDGEEKKVMVDEIVDMNELIEKYGKTVSKSLTFSGHKLQGRTEFQGMQISIENKKGTYRSGIDSDGHAWKTFMNYTYGYIRGTVGTDGDHVDCYIGDNKDSKNVYIIHQNDPVTHKYDEDKCMLGFNSGIEAKKAYLKQYDKPGFYGSMETMSVEDFKAKVYGNKGKKITVEKSSLFQQDFSKVMSGIGWY